MRQQLAQQTTAASTRSQSNSATSDISYEDGEPFEAAQIDTTFLPSPPPEAALHSAKLAALHARLSLPQKLPLQTMARTLVDASADPSPNFNNASLSAIGSSLLSYHVSEWILCTYPRLPMTILFAAMYAYAGPKTLAKVAAEWGVEAAAAPGSEVDAGYLQFSRMKPGSTPATGSLRKDLSHYRRGVSSRVVYDNEFGDTISPDAKAEDSKVLEEAYATFVKALVGSVYLHGGRQAAKTFVRQHMLSRHLDISSLFEFKFPTRDLARLCAREDFDAPVARLLSETGRLSRHPVFVVGIFSGNDKLGEGAGASLDEARTRAAVSALKSWYLYSPGRDVRVPSEMEIGGEKAKEWEPVHIDLGEIVG
jgi:dsRNA-specific ribonuclease